MTWWGTALIAIACGIVAAAPFLFPLLADRRRQRKRQRPPVMVELPDGASAEVHEGMVLVSGAQISPEATGKIEEFYKEFYGLGTPPGRAIVLEAEPVRPRIRCSECDAFMDEDGDAFVCPCGREVRA